jgi:hypothetical protein
MRRPSRIRRWFKWGGFVLSIAIFSAWALSLRWTWDYGRTRLSEDGVQQHDTFSRASFIRGVAVCVHSHQPVMCDSDECKVSRARDIDGFWYPTRVSWDYPNWYIQIPLWIPFLLIAIPTAFLIWRDRRIPHGHCQKCGYNLTGNASGICPECGTTILSAPS